MHQKLWSNVEKFVVGLDFDGAVRMLEPHLASPKDGRFSALAGRGFSNDPKKILSSINDFLKKACKGFNVKAVYLEMNGFDINYDEWFFDLFGFDNYRADPDWLGDWQSERYESVTLTGLEDIQKEFEWYDENEICEDKSYAKVYEAALLLVMVRFVSLIQQAFESGRLIRPVPLLAAAHDFGIVAEFK